MAFLLPNGPGQALGDVLATCKPLLATAKVWYVSSLIGSDSSGRGLDDKRPLATLKQAITNSASGDIIILMDGHTETSGGDADWSCTGKKLAIIGAGLSAGLPTAKLIAGNVGAVGGQVFFDTAYSQIRNVYFGARTVANVNSRLATNTTFFKCIGCYFECDQYDTGAGYEIDGTGAITLVKDCIFKSIATSSAAQPSVGLINGNTMPYLRLDGCTFDGGTVGFSNPYACYINNTVSQLEAENLSLLRGADMKIQSASTGWVNVQTSSGGARVDW